MSDERMRFEIDAGEWLAMIRRVGKLEGAIEAHSWLTKGDRRACDETLYELARETDDE